MVRYSNRVSKETIRGIAMAAGLELCPFFRCALMANESERDLDTKSLNCCPPCQGKLNDAIQQRGLPPSGNMRW